MGTWGKIGSLLTGDVTPYLGERLYETSPLGSSGPAAPATPWTNQEQGKDPTGQYYLGPGGELLKNDDGTPFDPYDLTQNRSNSNTAKYRNARENFKKWQANQFSRDGKPIYSKEEIESPLNPVNAWWQQAGAGQYSPAPQAAPPPTTRTNTKVQGGSPWATTDVSGADTALANQQGELEKFKSGWGAKWGDTTPVKADSTGWDVTKSVYGNPSNAPGVKEVDDGTGFIKKGAGSYGNIDAVSNSFLTPGRGEDWYNQNGDWFNKPGQAETTALTSLGELSKAGQLENEWKNIAATFENINEGAGAKADAIATRERAQNAQKFFDQNQQWFKENKLQDEYNNYFGSQLRGPSASEQRYTSGTGAQGLENYYGRSLQMAQKDLGNSLAARGIYDSGRALRAEEEQRANMAAQYGKDINALAAQSDQAMLARTGGARDFLSAANQAGVARMGLGGQIASAADTAQLRGGELSQGAFRLASQEALDRTRGMFDVTRSAQEARDNRLRAVTQEGFAGATTRANILGRGADIAFKVDEGKRSALNSYIAAQDTAGRGFRETGRDLGAMGSYKATMINNAVRALVDGAADWTDQQIKVLDSRLRAAGLELSQFLELQGESQNLILKRLGLQQFVTQEKNYITGQQQAADQLALSGATGLTGSAGAGYDPQFVNDILQSEIAKGGAQAQWYKSIADDLSKGAITALSAVERYQALKKQQQKQEDASAPTKV